MYIFKFLVFSSLVFGSFGAFSQSSYTGPVRVHCNTASGHCNLYVGNSVQNPASCAGDRSWYVFDKTSDIWKMQLAIALTAQSTGKSVSIGGTGACTMRPNTHEDIQHITLVD